MNLDIHHQADVVQALHIVITRLAYLHKNVNDRVLVAHKGGILVHTRLQTMFNLKFAVPIEQSLHEVIMSHALAAERLGPGGFDACIERLLEKFDVHSSSDQSAEHSMNSSDILGIGATVPSALDVDWVLTEHLSIANIKTQAMLRQALNLAGFAGRIMIEKALGKPSVELVRGYSFEQNPAWPISVKLERPKIVCFEKRGHK